MEFNFEPKRTPLGKYRCRWPGCPFGSYSFDHLSKVHEQQEHTQCSCGAYYTQINKHLANMKRHKPREHHAPVENATG